GSVVEHLPSFSSGCDPGVLCRPAPGPSSLCVCPQYSARLEKEEEPVQNPRRARKRRENLNMEKLYNENEGKLEIERQPEDEGEPEEEGNQGRKKSWKWRGSQGMRESSRIRDSQMTRGNQKMRESRKSRASLRMREKPDGEDKPESLAKPGGERPAAGKCPAEDYMPRKEKKTGWGDGQSPQGPSGGLTGKALEYVKGSGRARKNKKKRDGFHWMQRDVQDPFAPRRQWSVGGMRGQGRGQTGLHDIPYP
uniref:Uncharacterized protein n=1 Tax=Canis lupus familiaris TaxID=9615 RepID=A0A8I3NZE2_CANLF